LLSENELNIYSPNDVSLEFEMDSNMQVPILASILFKKNESTKKFIQIKSLKNEDKINYCSIDNECLN
jgi:hypothetical protein